MNNKHDEDMVEINLDLPPEPAARLDNLRKRFGEELIANTSHIKEA